MPDLLTTLKSENDLVILSTTTSGRPTECHTRAHKHVGWLVGWIMYGWRNDERALLRHSLSGFGSDMQRLQSEIYACAPPHFYSAPLRLQCIFSLAQLLRPAGTRPVFPLLIGIFRTCSGKNRYRRFCCPALPMDRLAEMSAWFHATRCLALYGLAWCVPLLNMEGLTNCWRMCINNLEAPSA